MTILQIIEAVGAAGGEWIVAHPIRAVLLAVAVVIGSLVTVKRLELPVWRWLAAWGNARLDSLGRRLNAGLADKVDSMSAEIAQLRADQEAHERIADRHRADGWRRDILRFRRELMLEDADLESYEECLRLIDLYEAYCREHPDYPNSMAAAAIEYIRRHYQARLEAGA